MTSLKLDWCSYAAAKYAVENWHYSEVMPAGKTIKCGVWEEGKFIGAVIFSRGANSALGAPYGLTQVQSCELTRIALSAHRTPVTRIVSIALRMLKGLCPGLRLVISFADPEQGHIGAIYQAGNWIYAGRSIAADEYVVNGRRMHGRSMRKLYGTHVGKPQIKVMKGSSKLRYLMPLDDAMRERLRSFEKEYPKRTKTGRASSSFDAVGGAVPTRPLQNSDVITP